MRQIHPESPGTVGGSLILINQSLRSLPSLSPCRLHNAVQMKQKDKQMISQLEKKLKAEQEARTFVEKQLMEEKKRKKLEEATAARAVAFAAATRCSALGEALGQEGGAWV